MLPLQPVSMVAVPTVAELLTAYAAEVLPSQAPATQYQKRQLFRRFIEEMGTLPLSALTPAYLRQWKGQLLQRHSPATARRYMDILSGVLTFAVRDYEWLEENPMRKIRKPVEPPGRVRFLSQKERTRLLPECQRSHTPALYPVVILALTTGARKTEILTLQWPDVDLEQRTIMLWQTKNGENRRVPVPGITIDVLRQWQKGRRYDVEWVFPRPDGRKPVDLDAAFSNACQRADIKQFRFHDLRHTAASYLAMSGASLLEIADILGHKTLAMVKRYAHLTPAHTAAVVERMAQQFLGE